MSDLRSRHRVSCLSRHPAASPWQRALAVLLVVPLTFSGCLGSGQKAPQGSQEEMLQQYRADYEQQPPDTVSQEDQPEGTLPQTDATYGDPAKQISLTEGTPLPEDLLREAGRNSTFKLINGVPEYRIGVGDMLKVTSYIEPRGGYGQLSGGPYIRESRLESGAGTGGTGRVYHRTVGSGVLLAKI